MKDMSSAEIPETASERTSSLSKWVALVIVASAMAVLILLLTLPTLYRWSFNLSFEAQPALAPLLNIEAASASPETRPVKSDATPIPIFHPPLTSELQFVEFRSRERLNVLLLGSDGRPDEADFPRTDTLMLLSWDREANTIDLLSLPRDLWVPVPGQVPTKINLVYSIGEHEAWGAGVPLLLDTIEALIGQPIHHYLWMDFDGFIHIVDQIGGIPIYVPWDILDEKYPTADYGHEVFELKAGYHVLDGATALKYARTRTQDGDFNRVGRQQDVVQALIQHVTDPANTHRLLLAAPEILRTLGYSFQTDLSITEILGLANQAVNVPQLRSTLVIDSNMGEESYSDEGMWVLLPNRPQIRSAFQQFFQVTEVKLP